MKDDEDILADLLRDNRSKPRKHPRRRFVVSRKDFRVIINHRNGEIINIECQIRRGNGEVECIFTTLEVIKKYRYFDMEGKPDRNWPPLNSPNNESWLEGKSWFLRWTRRRMETYKEALKVFL